MFTVKNFRVAYEKYIDYLTKNRDLNLEVNLLKDFKMVVSVETMYINNRC